MDPSHFLIIAAMITTVGIGVLILSSLVQWTASEVGNFPRQTVVLLGWVLVMIGILIGSVLVGMVPGVIALIVAAMVIQRSLRAPRQALLWTLAIATERSIPLVPAVEAFAQERGGLLGSRARNLAQYLRAGWPLPDALERSGTAGSGEALAVIRAGQESGNLAAALRRAADAPRAMDAVWGAFSGRLGYLCIVFLFVLSIVIFLDLKIMPVMQRIFLDFGQSLPTSTRHLISASHAIVRYWYLAGWLLPLLLVVLVHAVFRYIGWVETNLPGLGWLTLRHDAATILDCLTLAADRGRPLEETLDVLARYHPNHSIRARLSRAVDGIRAGTAWTVSLRRQELVAASEQAVLEAAQRVGNLAWALREMADRSRRRMVHRMEVLSRVLFPLGLLALGFAVLVIVVAYFTPLIFLISRLSQA